MIASRGLTGRSLGLAVSWAVVSCLVLLSLVACSDSTGGSDPTASPVATEPLTEPATFTNTAGQDLTESLTGTMGSLGIALSNQTRTDRYGSWHPLTLTADAPLLTFDPTTLLVNDTSYEWDISRVEAAWATVAAYIVEDWVDSELVWDDSDSARATVAQRVTESGRLFLGEDVNFADLLVPDGGGLSATVLGPWVVDQDWGEWRQNGVPDLEHSDPAVVQQAETYAANLVPAEPWPYSLERPRTFITDLVPFGIMSTENISNFSLTARVDFYRPIRVADSDTPRYEKGSAYLAFGIMSFGDYALINEFESADLSYRDLASLSANDVSRLPLIAEPVGGLKSAFVDRWAFNLPTDAVNDDDSSCATGSSTNEALTYTTYDLAPVSDTEGGCLELWSTTSGAVTTASDWSVYPTSQVWGLRNGTVLGLVSVDQFPDHDSVMISVIDQQGAQLQLQATVAPGTGQTWAAPLAASIQLDAG
ncbi:MAG: hypothetical protein LBL92_02710 [Propionibacteriaceae bacterium]|jgi:hypothetical protein|nr:hypothetical protein [Propionibacteriaceae bacterium]